MLSIITPLHAPGNTFIQETYESLCAQTVQDWTWVILENHGGFVPDSIAHAKDPRVRVWTNGDGLEGVGALKRRCCKFASGEFVVELDADDLLRPDALQLILEGFATGADFVYSDVAEFKTGSYAPVWPYDPIYGWSSYITQMPNGKILNANRQPPLTPQNFRYIDWSPNHVRAWRADTYWELGGHEAGLLVADDHDLVVRFYLAGKKFHHIEDAIYYYRIHDQNTVKTRNEEIRRGTEVIYDRHIWALAEKFANDNKLLKVDLCCWQTQIPGYEGWDEHNYGHNKVANLNGPWPAADNSVGLIRAQDALEHLHDRIHTMNEAFRVLAPGGFFLANTPSTNGMGAFCDPTHVSYWNKLSFRYYTSAQYAAYIPAFKGRFETLRVQELDTDPGVVTVQSHLVAQKPGYEHMGPSGWPRELTPRIPMLNVSA